jgi:hypothetical protein
MKIYKVKCAKGHIVEVSAQDDSEFQFCASESDCGAIVLIVSERIEI